MNPSREKNRTRLFLFPEITPDGLEPNEPAFYLCWPSWERFRLKVLGQATPPPLLKAYCLEDLPFFQLSLTSLLNLAREGSPSYGLNLKSLPLWTEDNLESLKKAINSPEVKSEQKENKEKNLCRQALILGLWEAGQWEKIKSEKLLQEALAANDLLWSKLKGEPKTTAPIEIKQTLDQQTLNGVWRAWFSLAKPILNQGDRLWIRREDFLEEARERLIEESPGSAIFKVPLP
ncbi:MAG: hypothetical protein LBV23_04345 [Deltaproteobacteria bacterium]|jgi:hypothetical protein|nr:hypothetical protein [Deltaproteobacteria bacterium]